METLRLYDKLLIKSNYILYLILLFENKVLRKFKNGSILLQALNRKKILVNQSQSSISKPKYSIVVTKSDFSIFFNKISFITETTNTSQILNCNSGKIDYFKKYNLATQLAVTDRKSVTSFTVAVKITMITQITTTQYNIIYIKVLQNRNNDSWWVSLEIKMFFKINAIALENRCERVDFLNSRFFRCR